MENIGVIIGIAVAVAVAGLLRHPPRRANATPAGGRHRPRRGGRCRGGGAVWPEGRQDGGEDTAAVDRAMASARALPMVGLVLDDVPGAQDRLREALREEIRQPTTQGPSRPLKLMSELRATHIVPALKAADETSAAAAIDARAALLKHLRCTDLVVCKEFAVTASSTATSSTLQARNS